MLVEFRQTIRTRTATVGVAAIDVRLVEPIVERKPGNEGTKLVGARITLADGTTVDVDHGPASVIYRVNMALKGDV